MTNKIIFVLGMHRSGTSAVTRLLNLLGAYLGEKLLDAQEGVNDAGFWENASVVRANEKILQYGNSAWFDVRSWISDEIVQRHQHMVHELVEVLEDQFRGSSFFALKDPRMCRLFPLWMRACNQAFNESETVCLIVLRNPYEVACSLEKRDGLPKVVSYWLWLDYVFSSEKSSRGCRRLFVTYDRLLSELGDVIDEIIAEVNLERSVDWQATLESIHAEINPANRHQINRNWTPVTQLEILSEKVFSQCASSTSLDIADVDRLAQEYNDLCDRNRLGLETLFPVLSAYFQTVNNLQELGQNHLHALSIVSERDGQISKLQGDICDLGKLHSEAIETVELRDKQLAEVNARLLQEGKEHGEAIRTVELRDRQLLDLNERYNAICVQHETVLNSATFCIAQLDKLRIEHEHLVENYNDIIKSKELLLLRVSQLHYPFKLAYKNIRDKLTNFIKRF